ncbi:MAG: hypothetical protein HY611_07085, partial [Elusimicrobia bacterium]|nr:hypothetical protein [Elusimicrobiota bacterium]
RFWTSLVDGGWLVVGHAEMNPEFFRAFRSVSFPGTLLFERAEKPPEQSRLPTDAWMPNSDASSATSWQPPSLPDIPLLLRRQPAAPPAAGEEARDAGPTTTRIRELADHAQWEEAAGLCRTFIEKNRLSPLGHFYHALVLDQMGRAQEAEGALNRAIYLERDFVLAHYHKGLLLQKGKDLSGAARSFRNALNLLDAMSPEKIFSEADGISAADLSELAQMQLDVLEGP